MRRILRHVLFLLSSFEFHAGTVAACVLLRDEFRHLRRRRRRRRRCRYPFDRPCQRRLSLFPSTRQRSHHYHPPSRLPFFREIKRHVEATWTQPVDGRVAGDISRHLQAQPSAVPRVAIHHLSLLLLSLFTTPSPPQISASLSHARECAFLLAPTEKRASLRLPR